MKKLLFFISTLCLMLFAAGCSNPAAAPPTLIGSATVSIPVYKITAPVAGKILGLILEPGERIGQEQPLFAIEQPELDEAVENAATEAARAEADVNNLESGSGQQALAAANYSLQSAASTYQSALQNYQKMTSLYAQNAIARIKVEEARSAFTAAEDNFKTAKAHLERLNSKASPEAIEAQKKVAVAAQQHYQELLQKQQTSEAQSPCTGTVTEKLLQSGDLAKANQHILTIRATEQCQVSLKIPQNQVAALETGQQIAAESTTLKKSFPGVITAIEDSTVTVMIENKLGELQAGMEVKIALKR